MAADYPPCSATEVLHRSVMVVETCLISIEYKNLALLGPMKVAASSTLQSRAINDKTATGMWPGTDNGSAN